MARLGSIDEIAVLANAGADVNAAGDLGNTPLHQAAMAGRIASVQKLLELGGDPKLENEFGQTALDVAGLGGHTEVVGLLKARMK